MADFQFYVTDDRYGVPSLKLIQTRDEADARELAERMLRSHHHHAVEVWRDESFIFSVGDAAPGDEARAG